MKHVVEAGDEGRGRSPHVIVVLVEIGLPTRNVVLKEGRDRLDHGCLEQRGFGTVVSEDHLLVDVGKVSDVLSAGVGISVLLKRLSGRLQDQMLDVRCAAAHPPRGAGDGRAVRGGGNSHGPTRWLILRCPALAHRQTLTINSCYWLSTHRPEEPPLAVVAPGAAVTLDTLAWNR